MFKAGTRVHRKSMIVKREDALDHLARKYCKNLSKESPSKNGVYLETIRDGFCQAENQGKMSGGADF